jgi:hypothetical protein
VLRAVLRFFTLSIVGAAVALACTVVESPTAEFNDGGASSDTGVKGPPNQLDASASACSPANVSNFEPVWTPPAPLGRDVCSSAQLDAFAAACDQENPIARYSDQCTTFRSGTDPCVQCIFGDPVTKKEGPLVSSGVGHLLANRAGCVANVTGDSSRSGCAAAHQALLQCQLAACATNCPVSATSVGDEDFRACAQTASQNDCRIYATKAAECTAALRADGGVEVQKCLDGDELALVKLFCGKYGGDGGL